MRNLFIGLVGLGLLVLLSATVGAQELTIQQKVLMPGPLVSHHAKYETDCDNCHIAFSKKDMNKQCLDCHKEIAQDRNSNSGFHGQGRLAIVSDCELCHTDHEGRDADIVSLLPEQFDHSQTRFALAGAHQFVACEGCHEAGKKHRDAATQCVDCHNDNDVHQGNLGEHCEACHGSVSWQERLPFDHSKTDYALLGKHQNVVCASCHFGQQYKIENQTCVNCHRADDVHGNGNGDKCQDCHRVDGWDQLQFDHDKTEFPLLGKHHELPCHACHKTGEDPKIAPVECSGCHRDDDVHFGRNGDACEACHTNKAWDDVKFAHQVDTDFPLTGKHQNLSCTQCHSGAIHDNLPRDCGGCHSGDDVHNDTNMTLCGTCHMTAGWRSVNQFDHDFSEFPLIGMHALVPCQSCHISNQFTLSDTGCLSCHKNDDKHRGALGDNCQQCHTPNAWNVWQFDHLDQTGYALEGKHSGLACDGCHLPGTPLDNTPKLCGGCHRQQDIHNGGFGENCDRCHTTNNFFELLIR